MGLGFGWKMFLLKVTLWFVITWYSKNKTHIFGQVNVQVKHISGDMFTSSFDPKDFLDTGEINTGKLL